LESSVKEIQKETKENIQNKEEFSKENQDLLEKQRQVAAMMDQILDPETKKLIDELKKMMDENMKDQIQYQFYKINV
jgi:DNA-binding TFAR19-related protein (PDSD5 family)